MFGSLRDSSGVQRAGALILAAIAIAGVSHQTGTTIDWVTAAIFGITVGLSVRWPIILPRTGAQLALVGGLLLAAIWQHGPATVLMLIVFDYATRMLALMNGRYRWTWHQPLVGAGVLLVAYGLATKAGLSPFPHPDQFRWPMGNASLVVLGATNWVLNTCTWTLIQWKKQDRSFFEVIWERLEQSWWLPLVFMTTAVGFASLPTGSYLLQFTICVAFVWLQSKVGPAFTTLHQDRAMALLLRLISQTAKQRRVSHRVMRFAHTLGRFLDFSATEMRLIGYAALLVGRVDEHGGAVPLWFNGTPTAEQQYAVRRYAAEVIRRLESDRCLLEVSQLVHYCNATCDGSETLPVASEAITVMCQVLMAASAVAYLVQTEGQSSSQAVAWVHTHVPDRFRPNILAAMRDSYSDELVPEQQTIGLPETVRQLQGLVAVRPTSDLVLGLRRIWTEWRGDSSLTPDLPEEVQAAGRMATFFATSMDMKTTAHIIVDTVGRLVNGKVALALPTEIDDELNLTFQASSGFTQLRMEGRPHTILGGPVMRALLNAEPYQVTDMAELNDALARELSQTEGIGSMLFVPLVARNRRVGLLIVGTHGYHWFSPREVGLINLLAGQAATALENARLIAEAEERITHISRLKRLTDTLLDSLSTGILVIDLAGNLQIANRSAYRLVGSAAVTLGKLLPEELRLAFQVPLQRTDELTLEHDVSWGEMVLAVQAVPFQDQQGGTGGAICLARDVTQERMMEQQVLRVEKMAAIGELAAGAAHEIRNPLTAIRGFIQLLQARSQQANGDYYQIIINEIDRIDEIIHDLLLLARPSELHRVETSLSDLVEEVLLLHHSEFGRQSIRLTRHYDEILGSILVDPKMFRQILLNLLRNAVQAMPNGGQIRVTIQVRDAEHVALAIADTGAGISTENLRRLFDPFFTTKEEGTGLGLSLCYSIVQAHQGHIDVESKLGEGTTFTIILPMH